MLVVDSSSIAANWWPSLGFVKYSEPDSSIDDPDPTSPAVVLSKANEEFLNGCQGTEILSSGRTILQMNFRGQNSATIFGSPIRQLYKALRHSARWAYSTGDVPLQAYPYHVSSSLPIFHFRHCALLL